jgi:hypothetical protein
MFFPRAHLIHLLGAKSTEKIPKKRRKLLVLCLTGTLGPCILIIIRHLRVEYCGSPVARNEGMAEVRSQHFWSRQASKYVNRNDKVGRRLISGLVELREETQRPVNEKILGVASDLSFRTFPSRP